MKQLLAPAVLVVSTIVATLAAAAEFPKHVLYFNHEKVNAAMVKGEHILDDDGLVLIANRGVQRGAEIHAKTNHVFIIVDGEAEFVTGGKMIEPKEISPGQIHGKGIDGGESHHLSKGDIITIPAGTPHQWKDTSKTGSVGYYAVNIEQ